MALTKATGTDLHITADGQILVRHATYVLEDGVRISAPLYARRIYPPGHDLTDATPTVRAIAAIVWTPDVIAAYQAMVAAALERETRAAPAVAAPLASGRVPLPADPGTE